MNVHSILPWAVCAALLATGMMLGDSHRAIAADKDEALATGNTAFALEMYAHLRAADSNLFFSPLSISTALAMTYAGAEGDTARQMAAVLHVGSHRERVAAQFGELLDKLKADSGADSYELHLANALWGQAGHEFLEPFQRLNRVYFKAGLERIDFVWAAEESRRIINEWVYRHTGKKVHELLQPGDVDSSTLLVLTNAIFFKGDWAVQFDPSATKKTPFHLDANAKVDVEMMDQTAEFRMAQVGPLSLLEMPYAGDRLSMVVLLPDRPDGLAELEKTLTAEQLAEWTERLEKQNVRVRFPRFKMKARIDLVKVLAAMGMKDAFTPAADFSGITGKRDLFISKVIHEAVVEVNEQGTEAAAATAVIMKRSMPPEFTADRPFLFLIRDGVTGSILFMGRVVDPTA